MQMMKPMKNMVLVTKQLFKKISLSKILICVENLGYDCPPIENLYDFITTIAGGSVAGAKALVSGTVQVAVNFCGGWHHAQRDSASGFCYINDCIIN